MSESKPTSTVNGERATVGIEQPPDLTPQDSALLDAIWADIDKRFPRKKVKKKKK